jgi:broad specificity phosphatase PhoE
MLAGVAAIAAAQPAATVALVGHNTANRLLLAASLGAPLAHYRRLVLANASISIIELDGDEVRWLRINDTSHLPP